MRIVRRAVKARKTQTVLTKVVTVPLTGGDVHRLRSPGGDGWLLGWRLGGMNRINAELLQAANLDGVLRA
jgi:hypothetical protein